MGSNHVLLGGMISPASAAAISCSTVVGCMANGEGGGARVDAALELAGAPDAAHEVDPLVGPGVADAEDRLEYALLQQ